MRGDSKAPIGRTQLAFSSVVVALVSLAIWWSWTQFNRAELAARQLRGAERNWAMLSSSEPQPTAEIAALWREEIDRLDQQMSRAKNQLGLVETNTIAAAAAPEQRAEAFFALAQFIETQHTLAQQASVKVPTGYMFGFSAYANSGPADEDMSIVHRQHQITKVLLETLWRSGAKELTRVQRELPATKVRESGSSPKNSSSRREGRPEDYLTWPATRSLSREGVLDTLAVRVGFVGKTATLRTYLENLAALKLPLIVRTVEVEPLGTDGAAKNGVRSLADLFRDETDERAEATAQSSSIVPIIAANDSEFLVTVEYLELDPIRSGMAEPEGEGAQ